MSAKTRVSDTVWFRTVAALLGIAIPAVWFWTVITPGEQAVMVRNALVARVGEPTDFSWTPEYTPSTFLTDRGPIPEVFARVAADLASSGGQPPLEGFQLAVAVSSHLMGSPKRVGGPIQSDVASAYAGVTQAGRGYCADFTQVFTAIATAAGLPVRTWGISFQAFGAGHAFNEVFDNQLHKWVLVDSFHSLYFVDPATLEPLSVLELHDRLLTLDGPAGSVAIQRIVDDRFPFRSEDIALDYYRRGMTQLALSWGSNVFDYERSALVRWSAAVSRHLERLVAIVVGQYPELRIYPTGVSDRDVSALFRARDTFIMAASALGLALFVFGWTLSSIWLGPSTLTRADRRDR